MFFSLFLLCGKNGSCQDAYCGELRLFTYSFIPYGWLECNGQTVNVSDYSTLYSIIGNTFGGVAGSTFCVPNLCGRVPVGLGTVNGTTVTYGGSGGTTTETMTYSQLPAHTHTASNTAIAASSSDATTTSVGYYAVNPARGNEFNSTTNASSAAISTTTTSTGGTTARNNMQPYLVLTWCICYDDTNTFTYY